MDKFKQIGKFAIPVAALLLPFLSLAVVVPNPDVLIGGNPITLIEIERTIVRISNFLIVISVVIAVIFIIWGGVKYMVARGEPTATKEATGIIKNGIIGAVIVLGVGVILNTVKALLARTFF